jgi:hypothetical protein
MKVFNLPVVLFTPALYPKNAFCVPVVLLAPEFVPKNAL